MHTNLEYKWKKVEYEGNFEMLNFAPFRQPYCSTHKIGQQKT